MSNNPYLDVLMKVATEMSYEDPMNPDPQPVVSPEEVAKVQGTEPVAVPSADELTSEEALMQEAILNAEAGEVTPERVELENAVSELVLPEMTDEELTEVLVSKVASEMTALGSIAKLVEFADGKSDYITAEMQKQAADMIDYMTTSDEAFNEGMEQIAKDLFSSEEAQSELYSREGLEFTFEQLATLESTGFEKQANEDPNALQKLKAFAMNAVESAVSKVKDGFDSARNLGQIGQELEAVSNELQAQTDLARTVPTMDTGVMRDLTERQGKLVSQQKLGRGIIGTGVGVGAAGLLYGGKKIHDHLQNEDSLEEKVARVLPDTSGNGTLNVAIETENNGGIQKMSKQLVEDFLKVAGAAALVSISADESLDMEMRKEASDAFDYASGLGRSAMTQAFVKVAQQVYTEQELHEIVAGQHTEDLFNKIAHIVEWNEMDAAELEKTAGAGSVSAKGVSGALADSKANIENVVAKKKDETEGAARETAGEVGKSGLAGGHRIGTLDGYNVIKNPQEYSVEQTAAALEEAVLTKQAAAEAYNKADAFIREYSSVLKK